MNWDSMNYQSRYSLALTCGWAPRSANKIAKTSWDKLSSAARKVITRYTRKD